MMDIKYLFFGQSYIVKELEIVYNNGSSAYCEIELTPYLPLYSLALIILSCALGFNLDL